MRRGLFVAACIAAVTCCATARADRPGRGTGGVTPIQHLVVIFQENVSFDHYFATYPNAANPPGEPPFRPDRSQFETTDQDHSYTDEQRANDAGLMDLYVEAVGRGSPPFDYGHGKGLVMGYYDGNTVTALWNYAQSFAMSDNSFDTTYGPSSVGAINLVSGQTHGFTPDTTSFGIAVTTNGTMIGDPQPAGDKCDTRDVSSSVDPNNKNIGDLLNAKGVTWGWFQGGFR